MELRTSNDVLGLGIVGRISGSVSSLLLLRHPALLCGLSFSHPSSHLHQDWKHHLGDLPFTWKSSLLARLADQFLIQVSGGERGVHSMRRDVVAEVVAGRQPCRPRSIPLRSPLSFHPLLHFSAPAIPRTLDLISWELDLGSWRFCLMGLFGDSSERHQIDLATLFIAGRG